MKDWSRENIKDRGLAKERAGATEIEGEREREREGEEKDRESDSEG